LIELLVIFIPNIQYLNGIKAGMEYTARWGQYFCF